MNLKKIMFFISISFCFVVAIFAQGGVTEKDGFKWMPYLEYGRIGAKSIAGEIIIPAKYQTCYYERGHFSVKNNTGEYGIFDRDGREIVPVGYFRIFELSEMKENSPYVVVGYDGYGLYSHTGKLLIPEKYRMINSYVTSKGVYFVVIDNNAHAGVANIDGKWIIQPTKYRHIIVNDLGGEVFFSYIIYGDERGSGVCDINGNVLIDTKYTTIQPMKKSSGEIYYKTQHGYSFGSMDLAGHVIMSPSTKVSYHQNAFGVKDIKQLYVVIDEQARWGIADASKKMVIPCEYDFIELKYPYIYACKGDYMELYNEKYECLIPASDKYIGIAKNDDITPPCIIAMTSEKKTALFDVKGQKLSDALHQHMGIHVFNDNDTVLYFSDHKLWGVKTLGNRVVFPARYQDIGFLETSIGNYYYVFYGGLVGLCDSAGVEIIEPQFTGIEFKRYKDKDYFLAFNDNLSAVFNTDGTQLINGETFTNISYDEEKSQFIAIAGQRKCYFSKDGILISDNSLDIEQDKFISIADDYFEREKYKLAAKNYGYAIDIKPTASLYFNRGVSYYNMSKYNDAISDFKLCLNNNPSKRLKIRSLELIDKSEKFQIQKDSRRSQIVSAIFGLALTGANTYFEVQAQKQRMKYSKLHNKTMSSHVNRSSSNDDSDVEETSSSKSTNTCSSLKVHGGKYYCANTGRCGMCGGDGLMDGSFGQGANSHKCTLCGGSGECKYCK